MTRFLSHRWSLAALAATLASLVSAASPSLARSGRSRLRTDLTAVRRDHPGRPVRRRAGAVAKVVVGNAAPTGLDAVLDAGEVQRLAHIHGLDWANPRGVRRIIVLSTVARPPAPAGFSAEAAAAPAANHKMVDALTYARNLGAGEMVLAQVI